MKVDAQECQILFDEKWMYYGRGRKCMSSAISYDGDDGTLVGLDLNACVLPRHRDLNCCITCLILINFSFIILLDASYYCHNSCEFHISLLVTLPKKPVGELVCNVNMCLYK